MPAHVNFTRVNKIESMYKKVQLLQNVKVERGSTFTFTRDLPYIASICQRASRAKTVGLRGGQLNVTRSIAAGTKILDRAVKSVM